MANLLDMVRLETGVVPKRELVPLEEIVGSALGRLESRMAGRPLAIDLPEDLPSASVDPVLFEQVVVNLLDNALKYTPAESPVSISARRAEGELEMEIADRGPGVPAGDEDRLFEKFYRGRQRGAGGVGLGLAICRGIVEAHQGSIVARNRPGGGIAFRIRLPLPAAPPGVPETAGGVPDSGGSAR